MTSTIVRNVKSAPGVSGDAVFCWYYGCRIAGLTQPPPPATGNGDWIRVARVAGGFVACVGDGSGHGDEAAPRARLMASEFDAALRCGLTVPGNILARINAALHARGLLGGAAVVHCDGRRIVAAAAGAPYPVLRRA
jgi:serine phosphatase RsbU (regulator of sigma subunit)